MKEVMLYPFSEEMVYFLGEETLQIDIDVVTLVGLKGNFNIGDEFRYKTKTLRVSDDFDEELDKCRFVFVNNFSDNSNDKLEKIIIKNIETAVAKNKYIILFECENEITKKLLTIIPKQNRITLKNSRYIDLGEEGEHENRLYNINTPVIYICDSFENLNKFDIEILLRKKFIKDGYKVLQLGTKQICDAFGFLSIPKFMYKNNVSDVDKVVMLNNYLKKLEVSENPDIIILGIPNGILSFSQKAIGDMGLSMYRIVQSVRPDAVILSIPYKNYTNEELDHLNSIVKTKFNVEVDYFNITPKALLPQPTEIKGRPKYLTLDTSFVREKLNNQNLGNVFSIQYIDRDIATLEIEKLGNNIINQFEKYGSVTSI